MRTDIAKVLVERPRVGGHGSRKGRHRPLDVWPTKEGRRRRWTEHKELNENLAPLHRLLARRVGRPWETVHAEISAYLTSRNAGQQHVRSPLADFVVRHLSVTPEGVLVDPRWRGGGWRQRRSFRQWRMSI